jgi:hypothetical protein
MAKDKSLQKTVSVFYALIAIFILQVGYFVIPAPATLKRLLFPVIAVLALIFLILGIVLIFLTLKLQVEKKLKIYFILTGASAAAFLTSILLHNLVYGLFILWFGEGFWDGSGAGDEAFFFILALFVCPTVFLIGAIGGVTTLLKKKS